MIHPYETVTHPVVMFGLDTSEGQLLVTLAQGGTRLTFAEQGYEGKCDGRLALVERSGALTIAELVMTQEQSGRLTSDERVRGQAQVLYPGGWRATSDIDFYMLAPQLLEEVV